MTHDLARLLLAGTNVDVSIEYLPRAALGIALCGRCRGPRPRQYGRRLCWYCQHPKRKSTAEPDPISQPPQLDRVSLDGTEKRSPRLAPR